MAGKGTKEVKGQQRLVGSRKRVKKKTERRGVGSGSLALEGGEGEREF